MGGGAGAGGLPANRSTSDAITAWVEAGFTARALDGVTGYDLSTGTE